MKLPKYRPPHVPDFRTVSRVLTRTARNVVFVEVMAFANERAMAFRQRILDQEFESFETTPLTEHYLARKAAANVDLRTMIATQHYVDNIRVFTRIERPGRMLIYIGFHARTLARDLKGRPTQFHLFEVARVQELGSENAHIPPRPHWKPEQVRIQQASRALRKTLVRKIVVQARKELKRVLK